MRYALILEYDGREFHGWQIQPDAASVQGSLQAALGVVADHPVSVVCAGRTDAGVHATAQVVHFESEAPRELHAWCLGANANLPDGVSVLWCSTVDECFHARFSALERTYRYLVVNRRARGGLFDGRAWYVPRRLDIAAMRSAATHFVGEHDFSAFRAASCQAATAQRFVSRVEIGARDDLVTIEISANAFLQNMVRIIAGALVEIGTGGRRPDWIAQLLHHRDRTRSAPTAPPHGLYLAGVRYAEQHAVPSASRPQPF